MTLSVATLVTGVLLALRLSGVDALTAPRILAVALLVVGGGVLVGAFVGRARWLIPVGLVLALALGLSVAASADVASRHPSVLLDFSVCRKMCSWSRPRCAVPARPGCSDRRSSREWRTSIRATSRAT